MSNPYISNPIQKATAPDISLLNENVRVVQPFEVISAEDDKYNHDMRRVERSSNNPEADLVAAEQRRLVEAESRAVAVSSITASNLSNQVDAELRTAATRPPNFSSLPPTSSGPTKLETSALNEYNPLEGNLDHLGEYNVSEYKCANYNVSEYKSIYE